MAWPVSTRALDELITPAIWNADLVSNMNAVVHPIRKTTDESVVSNATPQNDDHLLFAIAANEVWTVKAVLWHTTTGVGHFQYTFAVPAGGSFHMIAHAIATDGSTIVFTNLRSVADTRSAFSGSSNQMSFAEGVVVNGSTAGNVNLQWAQASSNASPTTLKANSYLLVAKLA